MQLRTELAAADSSYLPRLQSGNHSDQEECVGNLAECVLGLPDVWCVARIDPFPVELKELFKFDE